MVRSVDATQFNSKFNMKSQDLTRSTQAGKIRMGTAVKKTTIDRGLASGASTFGDYQKASATSGTGLKKHVSSKTTSSLSEFTSKTSLAKDGLAKGGASSKAGDDAKELKGGRLDKEGTTQTSSGSGGTGVKSAIKKASMTTSQSSSGLRKNWGSSVSKTGSISRKIADGQHTVEEQDDEEDRDGLGRLVATPDKKHKYVTHDPMLGITNVYSMGAKGMFAAGKR